MGTTRVLALFVLVPFELSGEVKVRGGNATLTAAQVLDVYRVEQRLKYLAFPAMGYVEPGAENTNTIQNFEVDGEWGTQEGHAAYLFNKVVSYGSGNRQAVVRTGKVPESGRANFVTTINGYADSMVISGNATDKVFQYLNAYNAPHWMNVFDSLQGSGGVNIVNNMSVEGQERYGSSWLRDWMRAYTFSNPVFQNTSILYNGTTDANWKRTPFMHASHDLGMSLDLGLREHISVGVQQNTHEPLDPDIAEEDLPDTENAWSKNNAKELLNLLGSDQNSALKNFLALYDITQKDVAVGQDTGSWDAIPIQNGSAQQKDSIRSALFGDGTQARGLVDEVLIGGGRQNAQGVISTISNQNPYRSINAVLDRLGIKAKPVDSHNSHFHIYLQAPVALPIASNILAETMPIVPEAQAVVSDVPSATQLFDFSYTEDAQAGEATMLMSLLIPYAPPLENTVAASPSAVVAQVEGQSKKLDMMLSECSDHLSTDSPDSQPGGMLLAPAEVFRQYMADTFNRVVDVSRAKVTVMESPKNGKLVSAGELKPYGSTYRYTTNRGFLGQEKMAFLVEVDGKRIKIVIKPYVVPVVGEDFVPFCEGIKRLDAIKTPSAFSPNTLGAWLYQGGFTNQITDTSNATVTFSDLGSNAIGQATGRAITLDINAAGHGWFVDSTPSINEEFLPTSNPNEWIAKAGSAAEGKMDMLSVFLHEYGHALGIEHSTNSHDLMATTLTPGMRRLPTVAEGHL